LPNKPIVRFAWILEFLNTLYSIVQRRHTQTVHIRACRSVSSSHTKARVLHTRCSRARTHTRGWHNTGKVACQTGIICNAAVVVVVGLKLHRDCSAVLPFSVLPHFSLPFCLFFPSVSFSQRVLSAFSPSSFLHGGKGLLYDHFFEGNLNRE